ncbi:helix-turn-helix domain-containing protein [Saccharomonospora cyanea]|uniref:hypothetical protein n=1 Tax=Saccharomonospora cyanea TaxID=40989 RepID=UPI0012FAFB0C|nr:hypothetical protein [Saccharomonospora cyanea]
MVLATFCGKDGTARPGVPTLAAESYLAEKTVDAALLRLEDAGLIQRAGELNGGTVVWRFNFDATSDGAVAREREERRQRARALAAERARRHRQRQKQQQQDGDRHAVSGRDVTPSDSVTNETVTPSDGVRNAAGRRTSRRRTAYVTPSTSLQPQVTPATTAIELPYELPVELPPDPEGSERANVVPFPAPEPTSKPQPKRGYTEAFEDAWKAYGRRGTKKAAFAEWKKAIKRADAATITAAIPPYVASTPELRFRKHMERWLRDDGWESAVTPARHAVGQHQPYQNPADISAYYEPLL